MGICADCLKKKAKRKKKLLIGVRLLARKGKISVKKGKCKICGKTKKLFSLNLETNPTCSYREVCEAFIEGSSVGCVSHGGSLVYVPPSDKLKRGEMLLAYGKPLIWRDYETGHFYYDSEVANYSVTTKKHFNLVKLLYKAKFGKDMPLMEKNPAKIKPPSTLETRASWQTRAPRTITERRELLAKYGRKAFLDPDNLKYPVVDPDTGRYDCAGILAAYRRARQYGEEDIAQKAIALGKRLGCKWARVYEKLDGWVKTNPIDDDLSEEEKKRIVEKYEGFYKKFLSYPDFKYMDEKEKEDFIKFLKIKPSAINDYLTRDTEDPKLLLDYLLTKDKNLLKEILEKARDKAGLIYIRPEVFSKLGKKIQNFLIDLIYSDFDKWKETYYYLTQRKPYIRPDISKRGRRKTSINPIDDLVFEKNPEELLIYNPEELLIYNPKEVVYEVEAPMPIIKEMVRYENAEIVSSKRSNGRWTCIIKSKYFTPARWKSFGITPKVIKKNPEIINEYLVGGEDIEI